MKKSSNKGCLFANYEVVYEITYDINYRLYSNIVL